MGAKGFIAGYIFIGIEVGGYRYIYRRLISSLHYERCVITDKRSPIEFDTDCAIEPDGPFNAFMINRRTGNDEVLT